jgi:hypothetical protein
LHTPTHSYRYLPPLSISKLKKKREREARCSPVSRHLSSKITFAYFSLAKSQFPHPKTKPKLWFCRCSRLSRLSSTRHCSNNLSEVFVHGSQLATPSLYKIQKCEVFFCTSYFYFYIFRHFDLMIINDQVPN